MQRKYFFILLLNCSLLLKTLQGLEYQQNIDQEIKKQLKLIKIKKCKYFSCILPISNNSIIDLIIFFK